ncbi:MAG: hypothetical protein WAL91_08355, partial [Propionicimonas sp.]
MAVTAITETGYATTGKDARNDVTGSTAALISAALIAAGSPGVSVQAQDLSRLTAHAGDLVLVPGTPLVTATAALAWNLLSRTTSATVEHSTLTATGDIEVLASSDAILVSRTTAASIARNPGSIIGSTAVALAAVFSANVVRGAVTASVATSTLSGLDVRISALADQAVIDATSQVSAIAESGGALADLLPKASLGVALAVNVIGWAVDQSALGAFLAAIDTLLGTDFSGEEPWAVTASALDSAVRATNNLALAARTAGLINATVSNTTSAIAEGLGLFTTASGAAGAVVASNKVSSTARALIAATGPGWVPVNAGVLAISADDSSGIYSNVKLVASSITTNDGGVHALDLLIPADWESSDGTVTLSFGDRIRLASDFGAPAFVAQALGMNTQQVDQGDVVALADDYAEVRYTTASGLRLVAPGDVVLVEPGFEGEGSWRAGYRYVGPGERVDLGTQDYTDRSRWLRVGGQPGSRYRYLGTTAVLDVNALDYADPTLWTRISGAPLSVYQWMGGTVSLDLAAPELPGGTAVPYTDLGYWKPISVTDQFPAGTSFDGFNFGSTPSVTVGGVVVLNDVRSEVEAALTDATVTTGDLRIQAIQQAVIRADADVTAESSGGSSFWGGLSLAVNAVIATNRVLGDAVARVSHSAVVADGDILVEARNHAEIDASVHGSLAASSSAVGVLLAFNTIGWEPSNVLYATIDNVIGDPALADQDPVEARAVVERTPVAAHGTLDVLASVEAIIRAFVGNDATSAPATIFGFGAMSAAGVLSSNRISTRTKAQIDNGTLPGDFTSSSNLALLATGDRVRDDSGRLYEFVASGLSPPIDLSDQTQHYATNPNWRRVDVVTAAGITVDARDTATITATSALAAEVSSAGDAGSGILNRWADDVLSDYEYTSNSGTQSLAFGDRVRVADDHAEAAVAGRVYQWMGTTENVDLGAATTDYADFELWKELTPTNLVNAAVGYDDLAERGVWLETLFGSGSTSTTFVVVVANSVQAAVVAALAGTQVVSGGQVVVTASEAASISSSDSSRIAGGGAGALIVSNVVLATADALIDDSPITTTAGGLTVRAGQDGQIEAITTSRIENGDGTSAVLAFNVIGWTPTNLLFSALEAFLGQTQSWGTEVPARASALVRDSELNVAGGIAVSAASTTRINAVAGNDNAVENIAGVILPGSGPDAEQGQVTGFGQNAGVTGI